MKKPPIRYSIKPLSTQAHTFEVRCNVANPDPAGQRFALPAWIPGSYLIRDFARHIVAIRAESGGKPLRLNKIDKHTWQTAPMRNGGPMTVTAEIYAWDLSVRGAHLDQTHAFFNGTSVFLRVHGQEDAPCLLDIQPPAGNACKDWRIATALEPAHGEQGCARLHGFGLYRAAGYDELIDHPVEMGSFTLARFKACGVPHEIAISGHHDCDLERLSADLKRICEWQIRFFGEPAPMSRYVFLVTAVGEGYGGLEHRASSALLCSRNDLPYPGMQGLSEGYRTFLGLCSHEYFHTWNVKRIKPAAFMPYQLERENYTTLLWAFEGFTSYYDDLALLRSGVIELKDWLELTAKTIGNVESGPGRRQQTLAESSFDAWSKFYRPDENTPNAVVSYYAKGALVALALDLTLRRKTHGKISLDDTMRALWQRHGKTGIGVAEDDIRLISEELSGINLRRFFADAVHGTGELPLKKLLAPFAIKLDWEAAKAPSLGIKITSENNELKLATVYSEGAAQAAGLSAGDILLAIDGLRVTPASIDRQLARYQPGDSIKVHAFRRDELMEFKVRLDPPPAGTAKLTLGGKSDRLRREWLGA
ncbi:MAG: M61 family metallopeptidase [Propionivibrio sp.]|uniref:M61 family metallopeptidase n=1 Tax=Candidatus Propionivibrio dominans TaxID=2954373 RepID=A0A9D7FI83_9RHOO|nr:M61 family metallopeptidase [Candidatus Propionivibrio dominans]MBL0168919.1 M61 family metallopeptidase [Propionivibrio sp.]